ncbi:MAG: hypothetical protein ACYC5A_09430 [Thermoleophilia bacterium]
MIQSGDKRADVLLNGSKISLDAVYALGAAIFGTLNEYKKRMLRDARSLCNDLSVCANQSDEFQAALQPRVRWAVQSCKQVYPELSKNTVLENMDVEEIVSKLERIEKGSHVPKAEISELQDFFRRLAENLDAKINNKHIQV